jgi:hypothetical protein
MSGIHLQSQRGQLCSSVAPVVEAQGFGAVPARLPRRARRDGPGYERPAHQRWAVADTRSKAAGPVRNKPSRPMQGNRSLQSMLDAPPSTAHGTASRPRLTAAQTNEDTLRNVYQALCPILGVLGDAC